MDPTKDRDDTDEVNVVQSDNIACVDAEMDSQEAEGMKRGKNQLRTGTNTTFFNRLPGGIRQGGPRFWRPTGICTVEVKTNLNGKTVTFVVFIDTGFDNKLINKKNCNK
jgi:hypothetical protein